MFVNQLAFSNWHLKIYIVDFLCKNFLMFSSFNVCCFSILHCIIVIIVFFFLNYSSNCVVYITKMAFKNCKVLSGIKKGQ